jgi:hypothetical protein
MDVHQLKLTEWRCQYVSNNCIYTAQDNNALTVNSLILPSEYSILLELCNQDAMHWTEEIRNGEKRYKE